MKKLAVVTGASSGIGQATARRLSAEGYRVICAARRADRIKDLAEEIDGVAVACDITSPAEVDRLVATVGNSLAVLVNNAGGAFGQEPVSEADLNAWTRMFEVNVIGTGRVTKALLPALIAGRGTVVFVTSTAAEVTYEGAAGYCGAKAAERAIAEALRLEIFDQPVRVCEISPGMVRTQEFATTRYAGDTERAAAVYQGVAEPLVADDIADVISFMVTRPSHVNLDRITIRPRAQAAQHKVHRS